MFLEALAGPYQETSKLVALSDPSQTRMDWHNQNLAQKYNHPPLPTYHSDDFDRMIDETKPDVLIVTTVDSTHHTYIIRAMELGCDIICEKPLTIDAEKAKAIFNTIGRTGRSLRVTFNYRYAPITTKVRDLIMQGVVGRPLHVNFQWVLDTSHGADYFRRWHREKDKSGGLLVHKATHHFDIINWWIDSYPQQVFALGDLMFYGRENATARGESYSYDRYTGAAAAQSDPFALQLDQNPKLRALYLDAEGDSGYMRDRNVFGDNISAEDTMSVTARYQNGALLTYSLLAYSPWEGYKVAITGDKGRVEVDLIESVGKQFIAGQEETLSPSERAEQAESFSQFGGQQIRVYPMFGKPYQAEIPEGEAGGHGGADPIMLEQIFAANPPVDPYNRAASHIDGAASILLGIAANESIRTGLMITVDDLFELPTKEPVTAHSPPTHISNTQ